VGYQSSHFWRRFFQPMLGNWKEEGEKGLRDLRFQLQEYSFTTHPITNMATVLCSNVHLFPFSNSGIKWSTFGEFNMNIMPLNATTNP
jgi:hypothetical protein